jgi:hypothetical protein
MCRLARLDWGAVIVVALCFIAVTPWLVRPGLPAGTDAEIHVPRVAEFARVLADGVLYPRWAPDFYLGYGYPLFNFYAPLVYYLAQLFYLFTSAAGAVKALLIVGVFVAGLGMYAFARRCLGWMAGVVAAVAFLYAPYLVLIDPFVRVDLPEYFAISLMPWVLWGFDRLLEGGRWPDVALAALPLAALALTHNLILMLFVPFLVAYLLRLFLAQERRAWARVVGAGALAVGLTAVFWLPALAEKRYVILDQVIGYDDFDFHRHFLTLRELLRPSPIIDLGALNPAVAYNLGLPQWGLGVVGWLGSWVVRWFGGRRSPAGSRRLWVVNFMGVAALALGFLTLDVSAGVWEAILPLRYVQFPWRLLAVAALPVAWLVGAGVAAVGERWRAWTAGGALALVLIGALPTLYPPPWTPLQADFSPHDMIELELDGVALGTTANREYTPVWVKSSPGASGNVLTGYDAGELVDRFDRGSLPEGASLRVVSSDAVGDIFEIASAQSFRATIRRFYFPGWRAWVDGDPVAVEPSEPHGFITVLVPAGTHSLELHFGSTLPRTAGAIGSSVAVVALLTLIPLAALPTGADSAPSIGFSAPRRLDGLLALALVVVLFFSAKATVIDRHSTWFRVASTGDKVAVAQHALKAHFEGQIALLGYDLPQTMVAQDGQLPLTLYWKATGPADKNYSVFVHLIRPAEHTWGQDDRLNPGDVPTTRWPADRYVRDAHFLGVLPGTPPGAYQIEVGLYEPDTGHRLFILDEKGIPVRQGVVLPQTIRVTRADVPLQASEIEMKERVEVTFGDQVSLLGYNLEPVGDLWLPNFLHVTLFWQAGRTDQEDLEMAVRLCDETGTVAVQIGGRPVDGHYPAPQWLAGEIVRDQHSFWLAEDFRSGRYSVEVSVSDAQRGEPLSPKGESTEDGWTFLTQVEVREP